MQFLGYGPGDTLFSPGIPQSSVLGSPLTIVGANNFGNLSSALATSSTVDDLGNGRFQLTIDLFALRPFGMDRGGDLFELALYADPEQTILLDDISAVGIGVPIYGGDTIDFDSPTFFVTGTLDYLSVEDEYLRRAIIPDSFIRKNPDGSMVGDLLIGFPGGIGVGVNRITIGMELFAPSAIPEPSALGLLGLTCLGARLHHSRARPLRILSS